MVALLLAALGFAFVAQVRDKAADDTYSGLREAELIQVLGGLTGTVERVRRERDRLEARNNQLDAERQSRSSALEAAEQRARFLNVVAGLVPVTGRGLRVTITESDRSVAVSSLLDTVQELRVAGAEAMEFNDSIRVTADSSFQSTGTGTQLDGQPLKSPYVLDVIGDPNNLRTALIFSEGPLATFQTFDMASVAIEVTESVQVTSVREPHQYEYAKPEAAP